MLHGKIAAMLFPVALRLPLSALAKLGVLMLMFTVGSSARRTGHPQSFPPVTWSGRWCCCRLP